MFRFIVLMLLVMTVISCKINVDDSVNLGNNYRYIRDYPQAIIYHRTKDYKGTGYNVVPPVVLRYNFNKYYIIAETKDLETSKVQYWIIDKENNGAKVGFNDTLNYKKRLSQLNIDLDF